MKKIGFLSFGHWTPSSQSQTRSAADTLLQSIDLAVGKWDPLTTLRKQFEDFERANPTGKPRPPKTKMRLRLSASDSRINAVERVRP